MRTNACAYGDRSRSGRESAGRSRGREQSSVFIPIVCHRAHFVCVCTEPNVGLLGQAGCVRREEGVRPQWFQLCRSTSTHRYVLRGVRRPLSIALAHRGGRSDTHRQSAQLHYEPAEPLRTTGHLAGEQSTPCAFVGCCVLGIDARGLGYAPGPNEKVPSPSGDHSSHGRPSKGTESEVKLPLRAHTCR